MRAHVMDGDLIANTIEVQSLDVIPNLIDASVGGSIGDLIIGGVVTKPTPTSDQIAASRLAKWEEIKAFRDKRLDTGGYQASGHWFNSDVRAKGEQTSLAGRADRLTVSGGDLTAQYVIGGENVLWKTMDNGYVPMTGNLALAIRDAAESMTVKTYKAAATHQYFLSLSATPATYDFSAGWPPIYGE